MSDARDLLMRLYYAGRDVSVAGSQEAVIEHTQAREAVRAYLAAPSAAPAPAEAPRDPGDVRAGPGRFFDATAAAQPAPLRDALVDELRSVDKRLHQMWPDEIRDLCWRAAAALAQRSDDARDASRSAEKCVELAASRQECDALHKALRDHCTGIRADDSGGYCWQCDTEWPLPGLEKHADACLAAPRT